jgi:hypothetical protein
MSPYLRHHFRTALLRGIIVYRNRHQADTGPGALEDLAR